MLLYGANLIPWWYQPERNPTETRAGRREGQSAIEHHLLAVGLALHVELRQYSSLSVHACVAMHGWLGHAWPGIQLPCYACGYTREMHHA
jgi:hypothetical protein